MRYITGLLLIASLAAVAAAQNTARPGAGNAIHRQIMAAEKQVWDAIKQEDVNAVLKLMASNAVIVDQDGRQGRQQVVSLMKDHFCPIASYEISRADVKLLRADVATSVYLLRTSYADDCLGSRTSTAWHSSVWLLHGQQWQMVLHHSTDAGPAAVDKAK